MSRPKPQTFKRGRVINALLNVKRRVDDARRGMEEFTRLMEESNGDAAGYYMQLADGERLKMQIQDSMLSELMQDFGVDREELG